MRSTKKAATLLSGILLVAVVGVGGYWLLRRTEPNVCRVCRRVVHREARAVMEADGQPEPVCCTRCALSLVRQQGKAVRLVEVVDYFSWQPLRPDAAFYVEGSRVILCEKHEPFLDDTKQAYDRIFDRCEPSIYAFAREQDARTFVAANGGRIRRLSELVEEVEIRP